MISRLEALILSACFQPLFLIKIFRYMNTNEKNCGFGIFLSSTSPLLAILMFDFDDIYIYIKTGFHCMHPDATQVDNTKCVG